MRFRKIIAVIAAAALGVSLCGCTSPEKIRNQREAEGHRDDISGV